MSSQEDKGKDEKSKKGGSDGDNAEASDASSTSSLRSDKAIVSNAPSHLKDSSPSVSSPLKEQTTQVDDAEGDSGEVNDEEAFTAAADEFLQERVQDFHDRVSNGEEGESVASEYAATFISSLSSDGSSSSKQSSSRHTSSRHSTTSENERLARAFLERLRELEEGYYQDPYRIRQRNTATQTSGEAEDSDIESQTSSSAAGEQEPKGKEIATDEPETQAGNSETPAAQAADADAASNASEESLHLFKGKIQPILHKVMADIAERLKKGEKLEDAVREICIKALGETARKFVERKNLPPQYVDLIKIVQDKYMKWSKKKKSGEGSSKIEGSSKQAPKEIEQKGDGSDHTSTTRAARSSRAVPTIATAEGTEPQASTPRRRRIGRQNYTPEREPVPEAATAPNPESPRREIHHRNRTSYHSRDDQDATPISPRSANRHNPRLPHPSADSKSRSRRRRKARDDDGTTPPTSPVTSSDHRRSSQVSERVIYTHKSEYISPPLCLATNAQDAGDALRRRERLPPVHNRIPWGVQALESLGDWFRKNRGSIDDGKLRSEMRSRRRGSKKKFISQVGKKSLEEKERM